MIELKNKGTNTITSSQKSFFQKISKTYKLEVLTCRLIKLLKINLMKKIGVLAALFVLLFSANAAHAQFGIRSGVNIANFDGYDFNSRVGYYLGVYYNKSIKDKISVEPGVFYSEKGYKATSPIITENLNYIDIPVLVRYHINETFNVFLGPQGSLLLNRKYQNDGGDVVTSTSTVRGYDIAGVFGIALNLPKGLNLQANYDLGLVSLNYFNVNVKNRVFKVSVGKNF